MNPISSVSTEELMQIALDLAGLEAIPEDSAIYVPGDRLRRVLFALDVGTAELLLAQQSGYDAVIAHHPVGLAHRAWAVLERHIPLLVEAGVPREVARQAIEPKLNALRVRGQASNYERVPMAARQLGIPFLNIHCPLDETGRRVMQQAIDQALDADPGATLGDLVDVLSALPAAHRAETEVMALLGDPSARAGKVMVAHGALTNGGYHVARACFDHGVDTVVYIHISPNDLKRLREDNDGQLIVTGHVLGDAFGIEPYIELLRGRRLEVDVLSEVCAAQPWGAGR